MNKNNFLNNISKEVLDTINTSVDCLDTEEKYNAEMKSITEYSEGRRKEAKTEKEKKDWKLINKQLIEPKKAVHEMDEGTKFATIIAILGDTTILTKIEIFNIVNKYREQFNQKLGLVIDTLNITDPILKEEEEEGEVKLTKEQKKEAE